MKTAPLTLAFGLVTSWFFMSLPVTACPACNIFNYLYTSVRSSPNIIVGTVTQQIDENTALVKVDRVLRGTNHVGGSSTFRMYNANKDIGKQLIFSNPTECCPDFPVLPLDGEWEVSFIIRRGPFIPNEPYSFYDLGGPKEAIKQTPQSGRPEVKDPEEAVRCVTGVSYVTRELGIQYAKAHPKQTLPLLKTELAKWISDLDHRETNSLAEHRLDGLVEALWTVDKEDAYRLFTKDLAEKLSAKPVKITITPDSRLASLEAFYIESMLRNAKPAGYDGILKKELMKALPELRDKNLVVAIYGLVYTKSLTPSAIEVATKDLLAKNPDQHLSVAVAYLQLGVKHMSWWAREDGRTELNLARTHCTSAKNAGLALQIDKEIAFNDRWMQKHN